MRWRHVAMCCRCCSADHVASSQSGIAARVGTVVARSAPAKAAESRRAFRFLNGVDWRWSRSVCDGCGASTRGRRRSDWICCPSKSAHRPFDYPGPAPHHVQCPRIAGCSIASNLLLIPHISPFLQEVSGGALEWTWLGVPRAACVTAQPRLRAPTTSVLGRATLLASAGADRALL